MDTNLFATLTREWAARSISTEGDRVLREIVAREPVIAKSPASDLGGLFATLDRRSPTVSEDPWAIVAALIRQLDESELLSLGLLVVLIPTMTGLGSCFQWGLGGPWRDREEFIGELVATTWTVLAELAGTTLAYPLHAIKRRVSGRLERWRDREVRDRRREIPTLFDEINNTDEVDSLTAEVHVTQGLADARPIPVLDCLARALCEIDESVLDRGLVQLIYAHRVLGYPISEISVMLGAREDALEYRARCAEALLCAS